MWYQPCVSLVSEPGDSSALADVRFQNPSQISAAPIDLNHVAAWQIGATVAHGASSGGRSDETAELAFG